MWPSNIEPNMPSQEPGNERITELRFLRSGKARDIYEVDDDRLLIVATDRISAFDCVLPNTIPHKGRTLTQLSKFWFDRFSTLVPNHMIAADLNEFPAELSRNDRTRIWRVE